MSIAEGPFVEADPYDPNRKVHVWYVKCANCGKRVRGSQAGLQFELRAGTEFQTGGSCGHCGKTLIERVKGVGGGRIEIELIQPPSTAHDAAPSSVIDALDEAVLCASVGALMGAALLLRRAVEQTTLDQGAPANAGLKGKLEHLESAGLLPGMIGLTTSNVRELGNEAAHDDTSHWEVDQPGRMTKQEELEFWLKLTRDLVGWFYLPATAKAVVDEVQEVTRSEPESNEGL